MSRPIIVTRKKANKDSKLFDVIFGRTINGADISHDICHWTTSWQPLQRPLEPPDVFWSAWCTSQSWARFDDFTMIAPEKWPLYLAHCWFTRQSWFYFTHSSSTWEQFWKTMKNLWCAQRTLKRSWLVLPNSAAHHSSAAVGWMPTSDPPQIHHV